MMSIPTLRTIADVLYPPRCWACRVRLITSMDGFCELCHHSVIEQEMCCAVCGVPSASTTSESLPICGPCLCRAHSVVQYSWWAVEYGGAVQQAIHHLKYGKQWPLAEPISRLFQPHPNQSQLQLQWDAVIAVPLHWRRRVARGFNQSVLLARGVARRLDLPLLVETLVRVRHTPRQSKLSASQRRDNLKRAFSVRKPIHISKKHLLLIDDVVTTGATVQACARALISAGAQSVCVWSLARKT